MRGVKTPYINMNTLITHSCATFGEKHTVMHNKETNSLVENPIKITNTNPEQWINVLSQNDQFVFCSDIDVVFERCCCVVLYECARHTNSHNNLADYDVSVDRWERLLEENNEAELWRGIDWRGEVSLTQVHCVKCCLPCCWGGTQKKVRQSLFANRRAFVFVDRI